MTTLREFILAGSSLATGNTVRDHIKNPSLGTGTIIIGGKKTANIQQSLSANIGNALSVNIHCVFTHGGRCAYLDNSSGLATSTYPSLPFDCGPFTLMPRKIGVIAA